MISDPSPENGETDIDAKSSIIITIYNFDDELMTLIFRSNQTGVWEDIGVYENVSNGRHSHQTTDMVSMNTTYWWSVNVRAASGNWSNETYHFTTTGDLLNLKWTVSGLDAMNRGCYSPI